MGDLGVESGKPAEPRRFLLTPKRLLIGAVLVGVAAWLVWVFFVPAGRCAAVDCVDYRGDYGSSAALNEFDDVWQEQRNSSTSTPWPWTAARTDGLRRVGGDWSRQCMRVRVYDLPQTSRIDDVPYLWQEYSSCYHIDGAFPFRDKWRVIHATDEEELAWTREIAAEDENWARLADKGIFFFEEPAKDS